MDAAPVEVVFHDGLREKLDTFECPFLKFCKAGAVDDVADVLFAARSIRGDVFFHVAICVENDFYNAVLVCPDQEVLSETWISLAGASHQCQLVIFLFASCESAGWAFGDADTAADAFFFIADDFVIFHAKSIDRETFASLHAGLTADAA